MRGLGQVEQRRDRGRWRERVETRRSDPTGSRQGSPLARLDHRCAWRPPDFPQVRLHVVTGKGGTGKSTVAAALALALATTGKNVLLCEVEGRQGIARMFDVDPLPYAERRIATGLPTDDGGRAGVVHALHIDPESALLEYLSMYYKLGRAGRALDRFGVVEFATTVAPGVRDVLLTGKVYEATSATGATRARSSTTRWCSTRPRRGGSPSSSASPASSPGWPRSARSRPSRTT